MTGKTRTANADNPYRDSLTGLDITDPVKAFFDWCIERESIRCKREAGEPPPWTQDPVFQKGRFLNVFRENDKGTRAVLRFAAPVKDSVSDLIHALFFARWCNQYSTLMALDPGILKTPDALRHALLHEVPQPWASEVYPVVPAQWDGRAYERMEACVEMFPRCRGFLEARVREAHGSVMTANDSINARFKMSNDFPIFMALVDLALFEPDLIRPDSPVPTGIGAAPYLDLLQRHLKCANHHETAQQMIQLQAAYWPEAPRKFTPIDVEYISCECRKYFSYINGTKKFEGKNLFVPSSTTK
jgi:alpha-glutamyl/putrescinyl thymine pyrophosphorylase clade 1